MTSENSAERYRTVPAPSEPHPYSIPTQYAEDLAQRILESGTASGTLTARERHVLARVVRHVPLITEVLAARVPRDGDALYNTAFERYAYKRIHDLLSELFRGEQG